MHCSWRINDTVALIKKIFLLAAVICSGRDFCTQSISEALLPAEKVHVFSWRQHWSRACPFLPRIFPIHINFHLFLLINLLTLFGRGADRLFIGKFALCLMRVCGGWGGLSAMTFFLRRYHMKKGTLRNGGTRINVEKRRKTTTKR
jgi:hypothetical protein